MMYDVTTLKEIDELSATTLQMYEDYRTDFEEHLSNALQKWLSTYHCKVVVTTEYLEIELPKSCMLSATQLYAIEHVLGCEFIQTINTDVRRYHFKWM